MILVSFFNIFAMVGFSDFLKKNVGLPMQKWKKAPNTSANFDAHFQNSTFAIGSLFPLAILLHRERSKNRFYAFRKGLAA